MNQTIVRPVQAEANIRAGEIAARLGLPLTTGIVEGYRFVLEVAENQLAIRDLHQARTRPVSIRLLKPRAPGRGRDLLARATGGIVRPFSMPPLAWAGMRHISPGWDGR